MIHKRSKKFQIARSKISISFLQKHEILLTFFCGLSVEKGRKSTSIISNATSTFPLPNNFTQFLSITLFCTTIILKEQIGWENFPLYAFGHLFL